MPHTSSTAAQGTANPQVRPRERLRIAFITNELSRAGAETQLMLVARSLKQRGHDVTVISMLEPTSYAEELRHVADDLVTSGVVPRHRVQVIPNGVDVDGIVAARGSADAMVMSSQWEGLIARHASGRRRGRRRGEPTPP